MDIVLMIGFLIGGLYILITGKIPSWLIGEKRELSPQTIRWLGVLLVAPTLLLILGLFILPFILSREQIPYYVLFEWAILGPVALAFIILVRTLGRNLETGDTELLKFIQRKANGSLSYAILSLASPAALVLAPLAIHYASQAIRMITEQEIGLEHRNKAQIGRLIGIISLTLWSLGTLTFLAVVLTGAGLGL